MPVDITQLNYVPTLAIRPSEMTGLQELPEVTKDRIQPLFLLAPWANSKSLSKAIERIERAFPNRPYFLDLDRYYIPTNDTTISQNEWKSLLNPEGGYTNWLNFLRDIPNANPCVQLHGISIFDIQRQVSELSSMGRVVVFRFELKRLPINFDQIINFINGLDTANHIIVIDGGWTNDLLSMRLQLVQLVLNNMRAINENTPIVISYTSVPKSYADVEGLKFTEFNNRETVEEIRRLSNRPNIIYGDWGSTRPREAGGGRTPVARIDIATRNGWLTARNNHKEWDFNKAANVIINSTEWDSISQEPIWGVFRIKQTVFSQNIGIHSPQGNVASRVNLHLHIQAAYDKGSFQPIDYEEDWKD